MTADVHEAAHADPSPHRVSAGLPPDRTADRAHDSTEDHSMKAQFRAPKPEAALTRSIEQAIARRWSVTRIMNELQISYEQYREVKDRLDGASRHTDVIGEPEQLRRAG